MPWGAVIGAVASIYGNSQSNKAANKGAHAQDHATQAQIDEQRREYDQSRQDQLPFLQFGQSAIPLQQAFLKGDFSGFQNSPDYKYALQQGLGAIDSRAASRGGLFGGGNTRDAMTFASGLATKNADNYWNKLAGISGQGQTSANSLGALGQSMANGISNAYQNQANGRISAYNQIGQNNAQMGQDIGSAFNYAGQRQGWWG